MNTPHRTQLLARTVTVYGGRLYLPQALKKAQVVAEVNFKYGSLKLYCTKRPLIYVALILGQMDKVDSKDRLDKNNCKLVYVCLIL